MMLRRCATVPAAFVLAAILYATAPVILLIAWLVSLTTRFRSADRAALFLIGFVTYECAGLLRLGWLWLRYRNAPSYLARNYAVQFWWANALFRLGVRLFQLDCRFHGEDAIQGQAAILICRHASMADNVLPLVCFALTRNEPLRYILKKELTLLPCLDIGGHRLPCLFVDRSGADTARELQAVADLTSTAGSDESVMIYPEGTRFSRSKQAALSNKPDLKDQVERWPDLLPPRLGGVSAMLEANPGKDAVFLCHTGFEGSASLVDLVNGSWLKQKIDISFWRVPYDHIGTDYKAFIFAQWDRMQHELVRLRAPQPKDPTDEALKAS